MSSQRHAVIWGGSGLRSSVHCHFRLAICSYELLLGLEAGESNMDVNRRHLLMQYTVLINSHQLVLFIERCNQAHLLLALFVNVRRFFTLSGLSFFSDGVCIIENETQTDVLQF